MHAAIKRATRIANLLGADSAQSSSSLSLDNNDGAEDDDDDVDNNGHFTHKHKHTTTHTQTCIERVVYKRFPSVISHVRAGQRFRQASPLPPCLSPRSPLLVLVSSSSLRTDSLHLAQVTVYDGAAATCFTGSGSVTGSASASGSGSAAAAAASPSGLLSHQVCFLPICLTVAYRIERKFARGKKGCREKLQL